jgi:hypothetical protein
VTIDVGTPVLEGLLDNLPTADLRWLLRLVLASDRRVERPAFVLLTVDALRTCAAERDEVPSTSAAYEQWRRTQACGEVWPSARLIRSVIKGSWTVALRVAGLEVPRHNHVHSVRSRQGAFTEQQLLSALRECLDATGQEIITYVAYREWALARVAADRDCVLPLKFQTFGKLLGNWDNALRVAGVNCEEVRRTARAAIRERQRSDILDDLRRAEPNPRQRLRMTRGGYDPWGKKERIESPERAPASSHTVQRLFGTWRTALLSSAGPGA